MKHIRISILIFWGGLALLLTTMPGETPILRNLIHVLDHLRYGDTIGHIFLFGSLTLVIFWVLSNGIAPIYALPLAMMMAFTAGTLTELSQGYLADRAMTISDLLANWLGVFAAGFCISYFTQLRHQWVIGRIV